MDDEGAPPPDFAPAKPKQPFLKRGTGVTRILSGPPKRAPVKLAYGPGIDRDPTAAKKPSPGPSSFLSSPSKEKGAGRAQAASARIATSPSRPLREPQPPPSSTPESGSRRPPVHHANSGRTESQRGALPPRSPRTGPASSPQGPPFRTDRLPPSHAHPSVHDSSELSSDATFLPFQSTAHQPDRQPPQKQGEPRHVDISPPPRPDLGDLDPVTGARRSPSAAAIQWKARRIEEEIELEEFELLERQLRSELGGSFAPRPAAVTAKDPTALQLQHPSPQLQPPTSSLQSPQGAGDPGISPRVGGSKLAQLKMHRANSRQLQRGGSGGERSSGNVGLGAGEDPFPPAPSGQRDEEEDDDEEDEGARGRGGMSARGRSSVPPTAPTSASLSLPNAARSNAPAPLRSSLRDRSASRERLRSLSRERRAGAGSGSLPTPNTGANAGGFGSGPEPSPAGPSFPASLRDPRVDASVGRSYAEIMAEKRRALQEALASGSRPLPSQARASGAAGSVGGSGAGMELTFSGGGSGANQIREAAQDLRGLQEEEDGMERGREYGREEEEEEAGPSYRFGGPPAYAPSHPHAEDTLEDALDPTHPASHSFALGSRSLAADSHFDWIVAQHAPHLPPHASSAPHARPYAHMEPAAEEADADADADLSTYDEDTVGDVSYGDRSAWEDADSIARLSVFTATGPSRIPAARQMKNRTGPAASYGGDAAPSDLPQEIPHATNQLVRELFGKQQQGGGAAAGKKGTTVREAQRDVAFTEAEVMLLKELEVEVKRAQEERVHVERVKQEVERERQRLARDRSEFEREIEARRKDVDALKEEEMRKMKRDRRVLEKQAKALLQLPTKRERSELEALQASFEEERKEWRAREARYKLTVERLRKQIADHQQTIEELKEEVRWHEQRAIDLREGASHPSTSASARKPSPSPAASAKAAGVRKATTPQKARAAGAPQSPLKGRPGAGTAAAPSAAAGKPVTAAAGGGIAAPKRTVSPQLHRRAVEMGTEEDEEEREGGDLYDLSDGEAYAHTPLGGARVNPAARRMIHVDTTPAGASSAHELSANADVDVTFASNVASRLPPPSPGFSPASKRKGAEGAKGGISLIPSLVGPEAGWAARDEDEEEEDSEEEGGSGWGVGQRDRLPSFPEPELDPGGSYVLTGREREAAAARFPAAAAPHRPHTAAAVQGNLPPHVGAPKEIYYSAAAGVPSARRPNTADYDASEYYANASVNAASVASAAVKQNAWSSAATGAARYGEHVSSDLSSGRRSGAPPPSLPDASLNLLFGTAPASPKVSTPTAAPFSSASSAGVAAAVGPAPTSQQPRLGSSVSNPASFQSPGLGRSPSNVSASASASLPSMGSGGGIAQTTRHPDGKTEVAYADGRRQVFFPNGTKKDVGVDGRSLITFVNGDIKKTIPGPDGNVVEYYYAQVDTWHTTLPSGIEVYHFPTGQTESHRKDGTKEILFPDGMCRLIRPSGEEMDCPPSQVSVWLKRPMPSKNI